jgi:UDP-3-O-[3-hydroxymyristoyl] N-acetylglucosamine deacetylase
MQSNLQNTIVTKFSCSGIGLHNGNIAKIEISPAPADTGIIFRRADIGDKTSIIKADFRNVKSTILGTTLSNKYETHIATIEHLMAALWGSNIDNCYIDVYGEEVPIMDGSAEPFLFLLNCAGKKTQNKGKKIIKILKEIKVEQALKSYDTTAYSSLSPSKDFEVEFEIDFKDKIISKQNHVFLADKVSFRSEISRARTFGFEKDVEMLRKNGLAKGGSLDNAIVVSDEGVINKEGLRFENEFVRHKILDCIGDLFLSGHRIIGKFKGSKSGHALNNKLLHNLFDDPTSWTYI